MMKILFVEDDVDLGNMYGTQLELNKHDVTFARTAQEALDELDGATFDVVVLDILLPGNNGLAVLHEMRGYEDWKNIPVVILSNITSDELSVDDRHLLDLGVKEYLIKVETTPQELATAVEAVV